MKKRYIFLLLAISSFTLFTSCADKSEEEAGAVADQFITSYYHNKYEDAKTVCDYIMRGKINEAQEMVESFPDSIKKEFLVLAEQIVVKRTETTENTKDRMIFKYEIFVPENIDLLYNHVVVVKDASTGNWTVTEMQE